jgi:phosphate transport system protein
MTNAPDRDIDPRLIEVDALMLHLFRLVADGLTKATAAFLANDTDAARRLIAADTEFDTLQEEIEELVESQVRDLAGTDQLALLLSILRIVPELERSGDLVEHIALRTSGGLVTELTATSCMLIEEMAMIGVELWRAAAGAYVARDAHAAIGMRTRDDDIDDLHVRLTEELADGDLVPAVAIEMGLVARFYERLGDHAVNIVRRLPTAPVFVS